MFDLQGFQWFLSINVNNADKWSVKNARVTLNSNDKFWMTKQIQLALQNYVL